MKRMLIIYVLVFLAFGYFVWYAQGETRKEIATMKQLICRYEMRMQWIVDVKKKLIAEPKVKTPEETLERILDAVWENCEKHDIPKNIFVAVIDTESCFSPKAKGSEDEIGLCQLLPETASMLIHAHDLPIYTERDLYNIENNVEIGALFLKDLIWRYGMKRALAHYHHGRKGKSERGQEYAERVLQKARLYATSP